MHRRMTITVKNQCSDETWIHVQVPNQKELQHGKWMDGSPPASIGPHVEATVASEKTTGSAYGTTGQINFDSSNRPGTRLTITWNKPYGHDPTTCTASLNGVDYATNVQNEDFGESYATCDVVIAVNTQANLLDTKNWMGKLPSNTLLNSIMMPGSHDAGMSELHHCSVGAGTDNTQTQSLNIGGQLNAGSRYFDIRVDYDHDELVTYHRWELFGCNGQSFQSVLDQSVEFISANPTEVAILKISHIRGESDGTKQKIVDMLQTSPYNQFLYTSNDANLAYLNLTTAAGKIVVVFNSKDDNSEDEISPGTGIFRYQDGFPEDDGDSAVCAFRGNNLTVCDKYADKSSYDEMAADQIDKWNAYAGLNQDYLFLLSWTLTSASSSIRTGAEIANDNLAGVLNDQIKVKNKPFPNIVYLDYIDSDIAREIINYNF